MAQFKKVFLGGTCNNSSWRKELIPKLAIDYFNPIVSDWNAEAQEEEKRQKQECDYLLYVITPKMKGVLSIAEAVDDSNKRPNKTVFCLLVNDVDDYLQPIEFDRHVLDSLMAVVEMLIDNNVKVFYNLDHVAQYLNGF